MATSANTFPSMQPDMKDQFAKPERFSKVKEKLKQKIAIVKKCKHCGKESCDCSDKIRTP